MLGILPWYSKHEIPIEDDLVELWYGTPSGGLVAERAEEVRLRAVVKYVRPVEPVKKFAVHELGR